MNYTGLPKKILMTTDSVGGVWNYSMDMCRLLGEYDVHVVIAVMGRALNQHQRSDIHRLSNITVHESSYKLEWMENPWEDLLKAERWILKIAGKYNPELIHFNNYAFGNIEWDVPVLTVTHSDVYSWWRAVRKTEIPHEWHRYYEVVKETITNSDIVIHPSGFIKDEIESTYGKPGLSRVIYNSRSIKHYSRKKKEKFILSMGRIWDEGKNLSLILDAAPEIKWPILIGGDNINPAGEKVSLKSDDVEMLGRLSSIDAADYFSRASIFVHPAKYEPFGLAVLEAALSGCALILGDIPSLREIWDDNAIYVNTENPHALVEALDLLIEDESKAAELGQAAFLHAQRYNEESMIKDYLNAYMKIKHAKQHISERT